MSSAADLYECQPFVRANRFQGIAEPTYVEMENATTAAQSFVSTGGIGKSYLMPILITSLGDWYSQHATNSLQQIEIVAREYNRPNWDGQGALPVQQETIATARQLIQMLPLGVPAPDVGADPDGQISLEWSDAPSGRVSISVAHDGKLNFAGLIDGGHCTGVLPFRGVFPPVIHMLIRSATR